MTTHTAARRNDLPSFLSAGAALLAIAALFTGRPLAAGLLALLAIAAGVAARGASQRNPKPMPYSMRWVLYLPRWPLTPTRLRTILEPRPGERLLEIGPGVGIYALPIAAAVAPGGAVDALDVQPEMLGVLRQRAVAAGVTNIADAVGDAQQLAYADASVDAVYLIGVLGEIPDPARALREFRRVLKPNGRLVIGEALLGDPDAVRLSVLRGMAEQAGFAFERRLGPPVAFFARFRPI